MKSLITLGAVALCGSLIADVSSQNIVGFANIDKATSLAGAKYSAQGNTFITVGSANQRFKLYDMKITGSMNVGTKKNNYIQAMNPSTLILDGAQCYYWDNGSGRNYWCYKNTVEGKCVKDTKVPEDTDFAAGTGFLCTFPNNVGLQYAGQVNTEWTLDADGYLEFTKPVIGGTTAKYFFVCNPFPVSINIFDMKIAGSMNVGTKKNNYIQWMQTGALMLDGARAYYWDNGSGKNYWCYKNTTATTTKDTAVSDFEIKPGEGFLCTFPNNVSLKIKAPQAIKDLMAQ